MSQQLRAQKPKSSSPTSLPRMRVSSLKVSPVAVENVMDSQDIKTLLKWCETLDVNTDNCDGIDQYQERLLQHIKESYRVPLPASAPIEIAPSNSVLEKFSATKDEFLELSRQTEKFFYNLEVLERFHNLKLTEDPVWLQKKHYEADRKRCSKKPMVLVSGSTSSGKSTLLNALLGECILPTDYNAATSVLCIIQYGEKTEAVIHYQEHKERVDLTTMEGRQKLATTIGRTQEKVNSDQQQTTSRCSEKVWASNQDKNEQCSRVTIYWPSQFLRCFKLIDSPGVTEDEPESCVSRQITELCQRRSACGFIYVLNGSLPAQEAAQVGGLLAAYLKGESNFLLLESAIFVINKWDIVPEEKKEIYLNLVADGIKKRWPGFQRHQLLTMNSKQAVLFQQFGRINPDLKDLCCLIDRMVPSALEKRTNKSLKKLCDVMHNAGNSVEATLRQLQLPIEDRKVWQSQIQEEIQKLILSLESAKSKLNSKLTAKILEFLPDVHCHLQSDEGHKQVLKWNKSSLKANEKESYDAKDLEKFLNQRISQVICEFNGFEELCKWANTIFVDDAKDQLKSLNMLDLDVTGGSTPVSGTTITESSIRAKGSYFGSFKKAKMSPVLIPILMAVGIIAFPIYYGAIKLVEFGKEATFRAMLEKPFNRFLQDNITPDFSQLREIVSSLLEPPCPSVKVVFKEIPQRLSQLHQQLIAQNEQEVTNIPKYRELLRECLTKQGELSRLSLQLDTHKFTKEDLLSQEETARGKTSVVYKVSVNGIGRAALKVAIKPITPQTAFDWKKEIDICRNCSHSNIVKFYGSVQISENPLKVGLLYEWCRRTLVDVIANEKLEPPHCTLTGFKETRFLALGILNGIRYLHQNAIIHRDLKPENILLTKVGEVRIADMGLAKLFDHVNGTMCGTPTYIAPELASGKPYTWSVDIFSIGIILWEMWNKRRAHVYNVIKDMSKPGFSEHRPDNGRFVGEDTSHPSGIESYQHRAKNWARVVRACWASDPKVRPSADKTHAYIKAIGAD